MCDDCYFEGSAQCGAYKEPPVSPVHTVRLDFVPETEDLTVAEMVESFKKMTSKNS